MSPKTELRYGTGTTIIGENCLTLNLILMLKTPHRTGIIAYATRL
jgi:hypothetical protein